MQHEKKKYMVVQRPSEKKNGCKPPAGSSFLLDAVSSTLRLARARNLVVRLANRRAPLEHGKVGRDVRRRQERVYGLGMRVRVLRGEVHDERRVLRGGDGPARRDVRERRERGRGRGGGRERRHRAGALDGRVRRRGDGQRGGRVCGGRRRAAEDRAREVFARRRCLRRGVDGADACWRCRCGAAGRRGRGELSLRRV